MPPVPPDVWQALVVTVALALSTTTSLLVLGLPLAFALARTRFPGKPVVEALLTLPLVLPPTVLGFYLLYALGPRGLATGLPFTFPGILLGSVLFNLPFALRPMISAFQGVDARLEEAAWSLGVGRVRTFFKVTLPLAASGILTGVVLTFAHTVGEFGVVLMLGGSRAGETQTLSLLLYDRIQALDYATAHLIAGGMLVFALVALTALSYASRASRP